MTKKASAVRARKKIERAKPDQRAANRSSVTRSNTESVRKPARPFLIVGVGASAGGMEAFRTVLQKTPADTPMAFVYVSHLDPKAHSSLAEIFQRDTKMRVVALREPTEVAAGQVYVLPPNRQLRLSGGVLRLEPRRSNDGYRPIDVFLESLAIDQGNSAVGVLLSGNGTDGIVGMEQIKAEGGITFAQSERSATFPALPVNAFAAGCVDFALTPEAIATELARLARHPALVRGKAGTSDAIETEPQSDLHRIFSLLRALNGVDFSYYKHSTLKRRIMRRMVLRKIERLRDYVTYLQQNPSEVDLLFHDLLINVTSFFRDPHVFQALRRKVFQKMVQKPARESVRIWIPGCSTGEEVYSLAIAMYEFFGKNAHPRALQIFATDISETALAKARAGIYPDTIAAQVSPDRLRRFFHKLENGNYQIAKFVRDSCVFARQNLIEDPPFSKLDLISCRNVLIYLGPLLQKKVIPIFHYALRPGGYLLLGGSETIGMYADLFTLTDKKHKFYVKRENQSRRDVDFLPKPLLQDVADLVPPPELQTTTSSSIERLPVSMDLGRHVDRLLLAQYAPSGVVVNNKMEVLQFRGQTSPYLEHPPGDASLNLVRMLRQELLVDVRTAISRAGKTNITIRKENIEITAGGKRRAVSVEVIPFRTSPSAERFYLILFHESAREERGRTENTATVTPDARREVVRLREELISTKESLQAIIEEQEATNEELKSANEEIQSSNEELQSTNEELETAKEELQSTNEELTTLNEELQNRNGELNQLNNDLTNLLSSVSMPILMLGNDLTIRRFTPLAERFFNLIPTDIGRRISDINPNIQVTQLASLVSEVIESLKTQEHDVQDRDGRWYSLRIRPYRTSENKIDGAVILLVDVDETRRGLTEFMAMVDQPLLTLRGDLRVQHANDAFHQMFHTSEKQVENKVVYELQDGVWDFPALRTLLEGALPEKNRVEHYTIDHDFGAGRKKLSINALRLYQRSKGTQITLVAFREIGDSPEKASP